MTKTRTVNQPEPVRASVDQAEEQGLVEIAREQPAATIPSAPLTAPGVNLNLTEDESDEVEITVPVKDANGIVYTYETRKIPREEYDEYQRKQTLAVAPLVRLGAEADPRRAVVD